MDWLKQKYFPNSKHRVEFFAVEWRSSLKLDGGKVKKYFAQCKHTLHGIAQVSSFPSSIEVMRYAISWFISRYRYSGRDNAVQCAEHTSLAEHVGDGYSVLHESSIRGGDQSRSAEGAEQTVLYVREPASRLAGEGLHFGAFPRMRNRVRHSHGLDGAGHVAPLSAGAERLVAGIAIPGESYCGTTIV